MCERELQPIKKKRKKKKKKERAPAEVLLEKKRIKEKCSQISRQSAREDRDKGKVWRRKKEEKEKKRNVWMIERKNGKIKFRNTSIIFSQ